MSFLGGGSGLAFHWTTSCLPTIIQVTIGTLGISEHMTISV